MSARLSPERIKAVRLAVKSIKLGQPLMVVAKDQGFSLRGNPLRDQGHGAMPTHPEHAEELLVLVDAYGGTPRRVYFLPLREPLSWESFGTQLPCLLGFSPSASRPFVELLSDE